jgi:competence protein ComEC
MMSFIKHYRYIAIFLLVLGTAALAKGEVFSQNRPMLRASFLDIGQGDSTLVETPSRHRMLIDGGPNGDVVRQLDAQMPFWDRNIDLVVLSHPQLDHITGLIPVLGRYNIGRLVLSGVSYKLDAYAALLQAVETKGVPVTVARAGEKFDFGDGATAEILSPQKIIAGTSQTDANETSVILRVDYGKTSFLFTGDADFKAEDELLATEADRLHADVLKVAHHGSKTSSGEAFLRAVSPRVAVVEVGAKNSYGQPAADALGRIAAIGAKMFRTDLDGTVVITTDGKTAFRAVSSNCFLCGAVEEELFSE